MRLNRSNYTTAYGIFIVQSEKKTPNHPTLAAETEEISANVSAGLAQGLRYHPIDKQMHVFALSHWSGILDSMVKQIGELDPCPHSFLKQNVAYLLFLLFSCKWKGWIWERMSERPVLGFVFLDVKRAHTDHCPVTGNVFLSLVGASTTKFGWSLQW